MILTLIIIIGLMIGSFLNVCIYRIPRQESVVRPRSHCTECDHQLKMWENIPLISYLLLQGRCSSCKSRISFQYLLVELLTAIIFGLVYLKFGLSFDSIIYVAFICLLIVITFIDIKYYIIPNHLLLIGLIPGIYPLLVNGIPSIKLYILGALGLGAGFFLIRLLGQIAFKKESMGLGDVKYAALIGLILGWKAGLVAAALAFLTASVFAMVLMLFGKASFGQQVPFGPFLSLGALLALIWGNNIVYWYLKTVLI